MLYCIHIFLGVEDAENFHGKPMAKLSEDAIAAIKARIANNGPHGIVPPTPAVVPPVNISNIRLASPPAYSNEKNVATRNAYGTALAKLGQSNDRVVAMDGDTKNSTFAITFKVLQTENTYLYLSSRVIFLYHSG